MAQHGFDKAVESLLSELCTKPGYGHAHSEIIRFQNLADAGPDEFTRAVIAAESSDAAPSSDKQVRRWSQSVSNTGPIAMLIKQSVHGTGPLSLK